MVIATPMSDDDEFEAFTRLPENPDKRFELIDGEIIELASSPACSEIAALIAAPLVSFVVPRKLGHVTGEGAGHKFGTHRLMPDVALVSSTRQAQLPKEGYNPIAPDLAVEVVTPSDKPLQIQRKLELYAQAGVLVWLVYPDRRRVELYQSDQQYVIMLALEDVLDAGTLLPGFSLPVRDIFPE